MLTPQPHELAYVHAHQGYIVLSLEELGCQYVLLDNYHDDLEAIKNNEASWSMLALMADKVVDLANQTVY